MAPICLMTFWPYRKQGKLMINLVLTTVVLVLSSPASSFAYLGNDWEQWDDNTKTVYVGGVLDAFKFNAMNLDIPKDVDVIADMEKSITECTKEMTYKQMKAIVKKYMEKNP